MMMMMKTNGDVEQESDLHVHVFIPVTAYQRTLMPADRLYIVYKYI